LDDVQHECFVNDCRISLILRYGKSQRPGHTEKYLHESEKSSQQNFCGQASKRSSPFKCCIKGKIPLKKGEKLHFLPK
jgi:hypothetical protein